MTKYEVLKMLEDILKAAQERKDAAYWPDQELIDDLIDVVEDQKLLEGERGQWPLSQ